jgi:hypothetical protein
MKVGAPHEEAAVVFLAAHRDVGDIEIQDDGNELTVTVGKFTHTHFANYDEGISDSERAERIVNDLVAFLEDVFADRVEFFGSHRTGGGFRPRGAESGSDLYVWSGPIADDG